MARYYYSGARDTVDGEKSISIYWLNKKGYIEDGWKRFGTLNWSSNGTPTGDIRFELSTDENDSYIRLIYRAKKHWESEDKYRSLDYKFNLIKTLCNFGGVRWFFQCGLYKNGAYCGRRVGILYSTGDYFGCRHCANLSYDSCNQDKRYRSGVWKVFTNESKAEEYYLKNVKRQFYRGKPTKKYQRYLKLEGNLTEKDLFEIERALLKVK